MRVLPLMLAHLAFGCADVGDEEVTSDVGDQVAALSEGETATGTTAPPTVVVKQGKLLGKIVNTTRVFLGIPYGAAPVGARRFTAPSPAPNWTGTRSATDFGPSCVQAPGAFSVPGPQSEDCLSLNVYTPRSGASKLPVMVFIHGGAFVAGGSIAYDGVRLSEEGKVIVVTINYRLGALGFLSHPALDAQRGGQPSGNDALRDQQLALKWVRDNIAPFGGNASNVTLFGESAGSMSTCIQMITSGSRSLAKRFVMESATCVSGLPINTKAQANAIGTGLTNALCAGATDVVACLRSASATDLTAYGVGATISGAGWNPVVNAADPFLPAHPRALIAAGNYNKGNIIVGSNAREWGLFQLAGLSPTVTSVVQLQAVLDATFGPISPYVKQQYTATDATANDVFVRAMTDYLFRCPARALARQTTAQGSTVRLYSFEEGAAFHAFELPYVFGNPNPVLGAPTLVEPLRRIIQKGLANFAKDGDPNLSGENFWPKYQTATDKHVVLKATPSIGSGLSKADCDFWDFIDQLVAPSP